VGLWWLLCYFCVMLGNHRFWLSTVMLLSACTAVLEVRTRPAEVWQWLNCVSKMLQSPCDVCCVLLLSACRAVLEGRSRPGEVWQWLRSVSSGGVSAGSLEVKAERAAASLRPTARRS
jgi:hypothetical protein